MLFLGSSILGKMFEKVETGSPQLLTTGYNNSVVSCDDISIDHFSYFFFFTLHVITRISSRVPLYCIVIDQINKLPEVTPYRKKKSCL